MNSLNLDEGIKIKNDNQNSKAEVKQQLAPIIISKLPLQKIKEKINNNEIYLEKAPPTSPSRSKVEFPKRKLANSIKIGQNLGIEKPPTCSLFNEESKSDDENNINELKIDIIEEAENEGRKSIYTSFDKVENTLKDSSNIDEIFDNSKYIKKLEEKWKYEKILLDYNIIDFTSK